ncbi:MAG: hypothetical protein WDN00_19120 [Limisphaerales bacterium]
MKNESPNQPENNDPLDALLRQPDAYIPDNGFTTRVLTSLPVRQKHSWRRFVVLSAAMLIGTVLVVWQLPAAIAVFNTMPKHWSALHWQTLVAFVPLLAALASLGWVAFAVTNEED